MNDIVFLPFLWVAITLPIILFLHRWIHRHLRGLALLITNKPQWAVLLYAAVLLPGVFIHEMSHWLTATLLGVTTGRISIIPELQADGSVQLGYVEYYKNKTVGPTREALIGGAPLIFGTLIVWLISYHVFDVTSLSAAISSGDLDQLGVALSEIIRTNDFFAWLYLLFAIGNAMMPSASDRRAWPAFLTIFGTFSLLLYFLGLQQILWRGIAGPGSTVFGYLAVAFSMTIGADLFFIIIIAFLETNISRFRGVELHYE